MAEVGSSGSVLARYTQDQGIDDPVAIPIAPTQLRSGRLLRSFSVRHSAPRRCIGVSRPLSSGSARCNGDLRHNRWNDHGFREPRLGISLYENRGCSKKKVGKAAQSSVG